MTKEIPNPNDKGNGELGSAPASGALFGALAEKLLRDANRHVIRRGANHVTRGGRQLHYE